MNKTITIASIETKTASTGNIKYILHSGNEKYEFWTKKKDGNETKAFTQFKKFKPQIGDSFEVSIKEEEEEFRNAQGKDVKYTKRTILGFVTDENHTPTTPRTNDIDADKLRKSFGELIARVEKTEKEISKLKDFIRLSNPNAFDLHFEEEIPVV